MCKQKAPSIIEGLFVIKYHQRPKMRFSITKPIYVLFLSLLALTLSFLILQNPNFEMTPGQTFTNTISTIILPHHDLAAASRQSLLYQAAETITPKTIILVSPNHFETGGYDIMTTDKTWRLMNAYLEPDKNIIKKLNIPLDESAFEREHGIFNLLGPLKNAFPDAKIVPIILKSNLARGKTIELAQQLSKVCTNSCLLVASVDFSHYQPGALAEIHDVLSLKALNNLDEDLIWQAEVDSNQALALALHWAKEHQTEKFKLFENTNSGKIANAPDAESTSYILGWFERGIIAQNSSETFIAGLNLEKFSDPRFLRGVDQVINLEDVNAMARLCLSQNDYCGLNQIFWHPPFWRETQNGLVVAGEILPDKYHLVILPTDNQGKLLRGEDKLAVINRIRQSLEEPAVSINYGYDTMEINR